MAAASGTENLSLAPAPLALRRNVKQLLEEHPGRFDFFQAVRLMLRFSSGGKPVGGFVNPNDEAIQFSH